MLGDTIACFLCWFLVLRRLRSANARFLLGRMECGGMEMIALSGRDANDVNFLMRRLSLHLYRCNYGFRRLLAYGLDGLQFNHAVATSRCSARLPIYPIFLRMNVFCFICFSVARLLGVRVSS